MGEAARKPGSLPVVVFVASALLLAWSAIAFGQDESNGRPRDAPSTVPTGVVAGNVKDRVTGAHLSDVIVTLKPAADERHLSTDLHPIGDKLRFLTDEAGFFYARIPAGSYSLAFRKDQYWAVESRVVVYPDRKTTSNVILEPTSKVIAYPGGTVAGAAPGSAVSLSAAVHIRDGSTLKTVDWTVLQQEGNASAEATISQKRGTNIVVTLPGAAAYKKALLKRLGRDGALLDRWMVLGLRTSVLKEAGTVTLALRAVTTSGTYGGKVDVVADLSAFAIGNPGLENVPIRGPVLLHGKAQPSYSWSLTRPPGSSATLLDGTTQNPYFVPDVVGAYNLSEGSKARLTVYAGTWHGVVVGKETGRQWISETGCSCHVGDGISGQFELWWRSGHAQIFSYNMTSSHRYQENCFVCHTVGFNTTGSDGIRDCESYPSFLKDHSLWEPETTPPTVKPARGSWDYVRTTYPGVAKLANVQCESCHGPQESRAHKALRTTGAPERISLSADVCCVCHDDAVDASSPQWRMSGHSNYNLAIEVATVEKRGDAAKNCGRCHSAQGFLAWLARSKRTRALQGKVGDASLAEVTAMGLNAQMVHPITCAVCHPPHNPGNSFSFMTQKVPIRGSRDSYMHPTEFDGHAGGRGALCVTCHSTDCGPHNDAAVPQIEGDIGPHVSQADVMIGRNAFFVKLGKSGSHSRIEDSCIWCHVKPVPEKSKVKGFPRGGVSHSFKTSPKLCSKCHDGLEGEDVMKTMAKSLDRLRNAIEAAVMADIGRKSTVRLIGPAGGPGEVTLRASDIRRVRLVQLGWNTTVDIAARDKAYRVPLSHLWPGETPLLKTGSGQVIAKAAWNYLLLKNDGSRGAHNPAFVTEVLEATMAKLMALPR